MDTDPSVSRSYQFAFGPVDCLTQGANCLIWQTLPTLPGPNFAPGSNAPLHWSPDGALALLYNPNTVKLYKFDPATRSSQLISADISFLTDEFYWSPDGKLAAAAVQAETAYSSYVALVDPANGTVRPLRAMWAAIDRVLDVLSLTRMQFPLGWMSNNELLVYSARSQPDSAANPLSPKKDVVEGGLYRLNIDSGALQVLSQGPGWLQIPAVSPRGDLLVFAGVSVKRTNAAWIRRVDSPEIDRFQLPIGSPYWSPDGNWLASSAGQAGGCTVTITGSDGRPGQQFQQTGVCYAVGWLPDSLYVLVVQLQLSPNGDADRSSLSVLSIRDGTAQTVDIPAWNAQQYVVVGFSFRRTAPLANP